MGGIYTDQTLLGFAKVDTPSSGEVLLCIPSKNHNFLVHSIMFVVQTAGVNASGKMQLKTLEATPTVLATMTVGTTTVRSSLQTILDVDDQEVTAGTGLQLCQSGADTVLVGWVAVYGSLPNM